MSEHLLRAVLGYASALVVALFICTGVLPAGPIVLAEDFEQTVLGPGLYAYQTRVRSATCGDDSQTGFVSTFVGTINGIPGDRDMEMNLINSRYWPTWSLTVRPDGVIVGESRVDAQQRESHFEVRREEGRFVGQGSRSYFSTIDGQRTRCTVNLDVLLRRFDV